MPCARTISRTAAAGSLFELPAGTAVEKLPAAGCPSDWGDFVDSDDEYEIEDVAESVELYSLGAAYPICLGEMLNRTYRVEHKLGHGGFSTVWMAHDVKSGIDVALKILIPGDYGEAEYRMQNEVIEAVADTSRLLTYRATVFLRGSYGNHRVLVFPLRGPTLVSPPRPRPLANRMFAAKQLLEGLKSLHSGGIIHGDLNSRNVMHGIASLRNLTTAAKYQHLGRPRKMALVPRPWKEGELVEPLKVPESLLVNEIYLGDFGLSIRPGTLVKHKIQSPTEYCAPERIHNENPSFATDMWSYMCVFAELYLDFSPFFGPDYHTYASSLVNTLGPFPAQWSGYYQAPGGQGENSWYDQTQEPLPRLSLEARVLRRRAEATPEERRLAVSIMNKGFSYLPENRLTAAQLLGGTSFKALMEYYGH